jgi:glycerol-3-phosphate O-acyltransferase / dihydroxyacetone phosphate acyltransferase
MIYGLLRGIARVAVRWYYRDVSARGLELVPETGPLLVVVNHPNALVDVLVVGSLLRRRLMITAKSTLFANPVARWTLRRLGVLPLRRASDVAKLGPGATRDPGRNEDTFRAVVDQLARGGAVLIFPEGKSHDDPTIAPLRTGAARMALQARDEGHARDLAIVPIGLTFERKEAARSRVHAEAGAPLLMREWRAPDGGSAPAALTEEIARRLRAVTLGYADMAEALRERDLARFFAAVADEHSTIDRTRPLDEEVSLARRMREARSLLEEAPPALVERGRALLARVDAIDAELAGRGLSPSDVEISTGGLQGARFVAREGSLLLLGAPAAAWGRIHHWVPFRLAIRLASATSEASRDQPAMRTIVGGLVIVLAWYAVLGALAWRWLGPLAASLYVLSLPIAADLDLQLSGRIRRMRRRACAYVILRRERTLRDRLGAEMNWIRHESLSLESALRSVSDDAVPDAQRPAPEAGGGGR